MGTIKIHDKSFTASISEADILQRVKEIAAEISENCKYKNPLFLAVLNGSFMFAADLMKEIAIDCEIQFIKMKSYAGMESTNKVEMLIGPTLEVSGRTVIILEDIVDTGNTIRELVKQLHLVTPNEIRICSLLLKPDKYDGEIPIDYVGFEIPDDFVVGYGLDYDGLGRNLRQIYTVTD
ncbi:hypoxanthine phosphoribosyltransferase [bacterium SCSIO 12643]|nr:hypoxanthine phosphoribosyltransferase [bacterium SCSIO 12643]